MDGFSFCFDCMRHHRKGLVGKLEHHFFSAFLSVQRIRPKRAAQKGASAENPGAPSILHRTTEDTLRPDEQNLVKEMKLSLRQMEEAGKLSLKHRRIYQRHINRLEKKYGAESRFFKHSEIEFGQPADLKKRVRVGGGR